jgi:putative DNA methylase
MGSGTTVGEAHKLGCRVIGRDINPVSYFIVKNALSTHDISEVRQTFKTIDRDVSHRIKAYYKARTDHYGLVDVLY